ncbi:MAG: MarR family winged helix-turn-helix transcriptional regulator [Actinomycetota bacterium]
MDRTVDDAVAARELAENLGELVPRLYRLLRTALDEEPGSASLEQLRVMHRIDEGFHNVSTLAAVRQMRMSAITAILDALVGRGWVVREPDPDDRRRTHVDLTDAGREALARGRELTAHRMMAILDHAVGDLTSAGGVVRMLAAAVAAFDADRFGQPSGR